MSWGLGQRVVNAVSIVQCGIRHAPEQDGIHLMLEQDGVKLGDLLLQNAEVILRRDCQLGDGAPLRSVGPG